MTHAEIANIIRQHSPGALPESLHIIGPDDHRVRMFVELEEKAWIRLPDDIAEAVLRDAMTEDIVPHILSRSSDAYSLDMTDGNPTKWFEDSDHGGPLGACFAAWKHARGIA